MTRRNTGGAGSSGVTNYNYGSSSSGRKLLLDNSGRFSGGSSGSTSSIPRSSGSSTITPIKIPSRSVSYGGAGSSRSTKKVTFDTSSSSYNRSSVGGAGRSYGISKDTAAMLKVIITLVEQLVSNTDKVDNIYSILEEYCKSSGNSELESAVTRLNQGGAGSGKKKSSYVPSSRTNQATINSLSDLKDICDRILVG